MKIGNSTLNWPMMSWLIDYCNLPPFSVSVFFVLVDEDGVALSGAEALDVLGRSDVLARIRGYGYLATGYAAVVPPSLGASKTTGEFCMINFCCTISTFTLMYIWFSPQ